MTRRSRAQQTEPYGYLVKPVKAAELRSTIALYKHQLDRRRRARAAAPAPSEHAIDAPYATLATMAASIANQVNHPLAVVRANAGYVLQELRYQQGLGDGDVRGLSEAIQAQSELESAAREIERIVAELPRSRGGCSSRSSPRGRRAPAAGWGSRSATAWWRR